MKFSMFYCKIRVYIYVRRDVISLRIGIIGAMDEEITLLKKAVSIRETVVRANMTFYIGMLHNKEVVICKSGVGKVNAAVTTQILVDQFSVKSIIFTGVAGAVDPELNIGDIVISTSSMQHDIDASALGFKKGEIPLFSLSSDFLADKNLVLLAKKGAEQLGEVKVKLGRVLTGDQFVADYNKVKSLWEEFQGVCVEMEGAAVAQTAMLNEIPFVIIRSMSDKANGEANVNFAEFTVLASEHSFRIVDSIVSQL